MSTKDCQTCAYARPFGGENDNRCTAWDCDYVPYKEAIKAYHEKKEKETKE